MDTFFIAVLHQYGYPALWLIVFLAAAGAPVSGNLLLYAAGAFAAFGDFNLFLLFPVALSAAVLGDALGYWLGRRVGSSLLTWLEKRRWRFFSPAALERGRVYFRRSAGPAIFFSRWLIVVVGGPINWLAGAERYAYRRFLFWDASGQVLGAVIPLGLGYTFAASWREIENLSGSLAILLLALLATIILSAALWRRLRAFKRRRQRPAILASSPTNTRTAAGDTSDDPDRARPTILILVSLSGGGHLNLAQALRDQLDTACNVLIVNPQSPLVKRGYTLVSRLFVPLLTWQFVLTDHTNVAWLLQKSLALFSSRRVDQIIAETRAQLIIVTHALVAGPTARANARRPTPLPLVFQYTDLASLHMTWFVEKRADAYLAPTREIQAQALQQGIAPERLHLTGRPARRQFYETALTTADRVRTLTDLGLDPALFTLFLQGGARGSAGVARLLTGILPLQLPLQIILATGDNTRLARRYTGIVRVCVLPFTENIAPAMAAADVIAGKAGASFITESFLLEKPFLVTSLIPGQETPNVRFIEQHNLGWVCLKIPAQQLLLTKLVHNPDMIAQKVHSIQAYKAWNIEANRAIRPLIERLLS